MFVKTNRAAILANSGLGVSSRRMLQILSRRRYDFRYLPHARNAVGDVGLERQSRLGQQQIDAVVDIAVINTRILLEGMEVFGQPFVPLQAVLQNLVIDLNPAGQLPVIDL